MAEAQQSNNQDEVEDDVAVSMVDILEAEEKLQEDANAVLGGSDDRNCTYLMGYVDRQALYSCRTCAAALSDEKAAGVCLACSLECHEGHELIELYTKRNFRCDCGNSKFGEFTCKLCPNKLPTNPDNRYNHNYNGLYCSCSRPYPDPDDLIEDEMIQCVICEDWFHKRHITNCTVEEFEEMICGPCMDTCHFLWAYARLCKAIYEKTTHSVKPDTEGDVDVVADEKTSTPEETLSKSPRESLTTSEKANLGKTSVRLLTVSEGTSLGETSSKPLTPSEVRLPKEKSSDASAETSSSATESCLLKELSEGSCLPLKGAVFWPEDWRKQLCRCSKCMAMYEIHNILFLLDENDTIAAYEARGKAKASKTSYQQSLEALSKLHHVQQVDLIQEYNDLKSHLTEYLKTFAENKKVVRQEDVDEFFVQQAARKRQKTESTSVPYFCK